MVRLAIFVAFVTVNVCSLFVPVTYAADSTVFRVTSYIPQYFKDFELQTTGRLGLSGSDYSYTGNDQSQWLRSGSDDGYGSARAEGSARYQRSTVQEFLDAYLVGGFSVEDRDQSAYAVGPTQDFADSSYVRYDNSSYWIGLQPRVQGGRYLASDVFLAVSASATARYGAYLAGDREEFSRDFDLVVVDADTLVAETRESDVSQTDRDSKTFAVMVDLRAGWGRMYDGSFAVTGMEFINELRKAGLIAREPSYGEMMSLAETIHHYRQTHAVDSRLQRIEALTELLTQLADEGVVADPGPYGFALVEDVWDYYPRGKRPFGWKISIGPGWSYEYSSSQRGTTSQQHDLETRFNLSNPEVIDTVWSRDTREYRFQRQMIRGSRPYLVWQLEYAKPLNLHWQLNGSVVGRHYLGGHVDEDYADEGPARSESLEGSHQINANARCSYYHDARTSGGLTVSYEGGTAAVAGGNWETLKTNKRWLFSAAGDVTYRISVPTSVQLTARWSKEHDEYGREYSRYTLSAGITHWLF